MYILFEGFTVAQTDLVLRVAYLRSPNSLEMKDYTHGLTADSLQD